MTCQRLPAPLWNKLADSRQGPRGRQGQAQPRGNVKRGRPSQYPKGKGASAAVSTQMERDSVYSRSPSSPLDRP